MENQEKLLSVALRIFSEKGYDATGVQEIVSEAGVTKPTLYHYFKSKRGVLDAIHERYFSMLLTALKSAVHYKGDLPQTLYSVVRMCFDFAIAHPEFYRMQLTMSIASPESEPYKATAPYQAQIVSVLEDLFRKATEQHGNMRNRQQRYSLTFFGMINTYIILYLNNHLKLTDETVHLAVHQFSHGIYS
jgi:TetR/AcrR family transcriptional regulator